MNVLEFVVSLFVNRGDRKRMQAAVREAATQDAQLAVATYADAFEQETSRLLAERRQQTLAITADKPEEEEIEEAVYHVVSRKTARAKPRQKQRKRQRS
jgi:hypothetical protein